MGDCGGGGGGGWFRRLPFVRQQCEPLLPMFPMVFRRRRTIKGKILEVDINMYKGNIFITKLDPNSCQ